MASHKSRFLRAFLLAFCLILGSSAAVQAKEEHFELLYTSEDKFLEIYSDHEVDPARCKAVSDRVIKAYDFITRQESWHNPSILHAKPLQFRLLGGSMKVLGYAQGPNLMVMKDAYMDDPLSEGTLAHELTHIQDLRQLQGAKLPSFMLEGRALTNGHAYRMYLGQGENSYDHQMAGSAINFTAAQAEILLSEYRGRGWNNQAIGTVLVEFMRTKWNGTGVPDIHPRLARMIERMAQGLEFEAAFQKEFGTKVEALGELFAIHLNQTQHDPQARLRGTIWQSTSPSEASGPEED